MRKYPGAPFKGGASGSADGSDGSGVDGTTASGITVDAATGMATTGSDLQSIFFFFF